MDELKRAVAVDVGGTKVAAALVTLSDAGEPAIEHYGKAPTEAKLGGRHVLEVIVGQVERVLREADCAVCGIGVSTGGVVEPLTGDITYANDMMPGWGGTHLGAELEARFGLKARVMNDVHAHALGEGVMNDVHAHALGEARWGAGRGAESVFVCAVGTGIGGAFVERGHLLLGAHGAATNIGHVTCADARGIPCQCGAVGHVETIAAGPGILERYLELGGAKTDEKGAPVDGAYISRAAEDGDEAAVAAETRSGRALGEVLGNMVNLFDPECVVLSGSVAKCGPVWHRDGQLGDNAPLVGAAENLVRSAYVGLE